MKILKTLMLLIASVLTGAACLAQDVKTDISVHDPVLIKAGSTYYIFCTGRGISVWSSGDMMHWQQQKPVFDKAPQWAVDTIPGFKGHIWAPDISFYNGQYYLYYSVSAFGKNTSAIGLATNPTLNPADPNFHWTDHGRVIQSYPGKTHWNAIDPNLITDTDSTPYLAFGSFWDGIKLIKLTADRQSIAEDPARIPTIATRRRDPNDPMPATADNPPDAGGNAIEGAFIFRHDGYFYLFASIDYCCRGPKSTYKMIIGRSKTLKGPYLDQTGLTMSKGGGSILLAGDEHWYGVGHNGVSHIDDTDYIIFHAYDAADKGISKLKIKKLNWINGWPLVEGGL